MQETGRFPTLALLVLAGAIFVTVTGEFLPTGLLPDLARDLDVSVARAGLLVSVFAGTVVVTAAPLAALTRGVSRKALVVGVLGLNAFATVLSATAPVYEVLVGARILGGLAQGLFWAVVGAYAAHLVPKRQLARATAVTSAGGSAAFVLGVPISTALGHAVGWRLAFGAIAVAMVLLALLVFRLLPPIAQEAPAEGAAPARRDATLPGVLAVCAIVAIALTGQNVLYTYIAPYITDAAGFDAASLGPILFLYGGAGAVGLVLAGIVGDRYPTGGLLVSAVITVAAVAVLGAAPGVPWLVVTATVVWGVAFGVLPPLLQTRNMHLASPAIRTLAAAWMTTAFNIGIGGGALIGSLLLPVSGVAGLPWTAAALLAVAALAIAAPRVLRRRKGSDGSAIV